VRCPNESRSGKLVFGHIIELELYNKVIKMPINVFAGVITTVEEQIYEQELDEYMEQLKEDIRELMKKPNEIAD
jgi:hypothetical protein